MRTTNVFIQLANKLQFERFGDFLNRGKTTFSIPDAALLQYACALDDYQLLIAKTQFKSTVIEV